MRAARTSNGGEGSRRASSARDPRASWRAGIASLALASIVAVGSAGCGGGGAGGSGGGPLVLTGVQFVDRTMQVLTTSLATPVPRNAQIVFRFSTPVDLATANESSIEVRYGPQFQSVVVGSLRAGVGDPSTVVFDPTTAADGSPNPFGLDAGATIRVRILGPGDGGPVLRSDRGAVLAAGLSMTFSSAEVYLRDLKPPSVVRAYFTPAADGATGEVPATAALALEFDEPMDPATFALKSTPSGVPATTDDTVDVLWYDGHAAPTLNISNGMQDVPVPGSLSHDAAATTWHFRPAFSWGDKKYVFVVTVLGGLKDLAGNPLLNPRSFGPFTGDGSGAAMGRALVESFDARIDNDFVATTADWGIVTSGRLEGAPVTSSRRYILGAWYNELSRGGQYAVMADPLLGADASVLAPGIQPPTSAGRRVLETIFDTEMGPSGAVTNVAWGPVGNATAASTYPEITIQMGFQKSTTGVLLGPTLSGEYRDPPVVAFRGPYTVNAVANVGNEYASFPNTTLFKTPCGDPKTSSSAQCLYDYRGFVSYPALTSPFEWDEGSPTVGGDSIFLLDISAQEGTRTQRIRGWLNINPGSGIANLAAYPRRMFSTYGGDDVNPPNTAGPGTNWSTNPEPSVTDVALTVTRHRSVAQSCFYTPDATDPAGNSYPPPYSSAPNLTLGTKSDYLPAVATPSVQTGGATIVIEYQGAMAIDPASGRTSPNLAFSTTPWTKNIDDCDGYPYLRWRMTCTSSLSTGALPRIASVSIPIRLMP